MAWRDQLAAVVRRELAPPPDLSVSAWAAQYRVLSREAAAEHGRWRNDRAPYLVGIMDAISDPAIEMVVVQKPRRVGGTEAGNNCVGYFVHQDPAPILFVQPTVEMAQDWSKSNLAPMLRDTPVLAGRVADVASRTSGNTIARKQFPGGSLTITGANSGAGFRMRTARVCLGDEIDAWPASAGSEGDPVDLLVGRADTFADRKIVLWSTPLLKGLSRIEALYEASDQRRYYVPCPHCEHAQVLVWANLKYDGLPAPMYACAGCGTLIDESHKPAMVRAGQWRAARPTERIAGFQFNALVSLFDGASWPRLVALWKQAQRDVTQLQVFVNQILGETWEDRGGTSEPTVLAQRSEAYAAEVPASVTVLTAGVDVQADRLECNIVGWGAGEESWRIHYARLHGDPAAPAVWEELEALLGRAWAHERGGTMRLAAMAIDCGFHTDQVLKFVRPRQGRRCFAVKGSSRPGAPLLPRKGSRTNRHGVPVHLLGTDTAKDIILARVRQTVPGPGTLHFAATLPVDYYEQLVAERRVRKQLAGRWVSRYEVLPNRRNEALDTEVYALAALHLLGAAGSHLGERLVGYTADVDVAPVPPAPAAPEPHPIRERIQHVIRPPAAPRRAGAGFVNRW